MSECRCGKEDCPGPENCVCGESCGCEIPEFTPEAAHLLVTYLHSPEFERETKEV